MRNNDTCRLVGALRCRSTVLSADAFEARQRTWAVLKAGNYHLLWHPQFVDYSLNRCPGAHSIEQIIGCAKFIRGCQQFARETGRWKVTRETLLRPHSAPAGEPLNAYFATQTKRAMRTLNCADRSFTNEEEVCAAIRHQYFAEARAFVAGRRLGDGTYQSYGYAAYHQQYIRRAWNTITKQYAPAALSLDRADAGREADSWSDWIDSQATDVDQSSGALELIDFKDSLAAGLRSALREDRDWDVFHSVIYRGETVAALAERFRVSQGSISDGVTAQILAALRSSLSDYYDCSSSRRVRITELREPLCDLLPEAEFLRLIPRLATRSAHFRNSG